MPSNQIKRISALASDYTPGHFDVNGEIGVVLKEIPNLTLYQVAAWPNSFISVSEKISKDIGVEAVPGPGRAVSQDDKIVLRVEPLKFWIIGIAVTQLRYTEGAILDLSHSRTHVQITGSKAKDLLNRSLPLDLRNQSFITGSVASTAFHHVNVTLWRSKIGFELFLPRGFALSLWELLCENAAQFGYEVT